MSQPPSIHYPQTSNISNILSSPRKSGRIKEIKAAEGCSNEGRAAKAGSERSRVQSHQESAVASSDTEETVVSRAHATASPGPSNAVYEFPQPKVPGAEPFVALWPHQQQYRPKNQQQPQMHAQAPHMPSSLYQEHGLSSSVVDVPAIPPAGPAQQQNQSQGQSQNQSQDQSQNLSQIPHSAPYLSQDLSQRPNHYPSQHHGQYQGQQHPSALPVAGPAINQKPHEKKQDDESTMEHTLANCTKDIIKNLPYISLLPIVSILGASTYHHIKNRKSPNLIPYKIPKWIKHLSKVSFVYNAYSIFKGLVPTGTGAETALGTGGGTGGGNMVLRVLGKLLGGVFGTDGMVGGTRDIDPNDPSDSSPATHTLSPVHAVQKSMAEHYYNDIYHRRTDTYDASPQALGGAAAIRVLSQEDEILRQMPSDIPVDQILVGCVMAEVERLLVKRGAERSAGDLEAALENVGRVALSTVFDIKSSQSRGLWERNSEPARDTLRDSWRDEYQETLMHGDGRGHRRSRRVRAVSQDYGYRGAADHGDGYYDWQQHGSADGGYGGGGDARATRGFNNDYSLGYEDGYY